MFSLLLVIAAAAPWLAPYPYDAQHLDRTWQGPSAQHLLGTDAFGRVTPASDSGG